MKQYTRKDLSQLFHIGKETFRYYESINLIPKPMRNESGYRIYSEEDLIRIKFIVQMKKYGFNLREITYLINMVSEEKRADQDKLVYYIDSKIIAINGSPRKKGNTAILINKAQRSNSFFTVL